MQETSLFKPWQTAVLIIAVLFVLPICGVLFSQRGNPYKSSATTQSQTFTNPYAILDVLPHFVYDQIVSSLKTYFTSNGQTVPNSITIKNNTVTPDGATYTFTAITNPGKQVLPVVVNVSNYDGTLSTLVTVSGQTQNVQSAPNGNNGTPTNNIDVLLNLGVSSVQTSLLLQAFETYIPNADKITLDTNTVSIPPPDDNGVTKTSFRVTIDSQKYQASIQYKSIDTMQLVLSSLDGKQLFDSGILGGQ